MTLPKIDRFNIRVYGLLVNDAGAVLLSRERIGAVEFTKLPGGGMELGEGTHECLIREFKEELGIDIEVAEHFYTTDFFQPSVFRSTDQLISIYYKVRSLSPLSDIPMEEFTIENDGRLEQQLLFWVPIAELTPEAVTFPIDKLVVEKLQRS